MGARTRGLEKMSDRINLAYDAQGRPQNLEQKVNRITSLFQSGRISRDKARDYIAALRSSPDLVGIEIPSFPQPARDDIYGRSLLDQVRDFELGRQFSVDQEQPMTATEVNLRNMEAQSSQWMRDYYTTLNPRDRYVMEQMQKEQEEYIKRAFMNPGLASPLEAVASTSRFVQHCYSCLKTKLKTVGDMCCDPWALTTRRVLSLD